MFAVSLVSLSCFPQRLAGTVRLQTSRARGATTLSP